MNLHALLRDFLCRDFATIRRRVATPQTGHSPSRRDRLVIASSGAASLFDLFAFPMPLFNQKAKNIPGEISCDATSTLAVHMEEPATTEGALPLQWPLYPQSVAKFPLAAARDLFSRIDRRINLREPLKPALSLLSHDHAGMMPDRWNKVAFLSLGGEASRMSV
jgi:hypothetical protein